MGFSRQEYWSGVPLPSPKGRHTALEIKFRNLELLLCPPALVSLVLPSGGGELLRLHPARCSLVYLFLFPFTWVLEGHY